MISAVVAEFNPFHNGHKYLLGKAKENSDALVVVMSGNFVQRGDIALFPKHLRAHSALLNGADLVVSLPAGWSMSGAENFAYGAVSLLKSTNIVDRIVFGCETDSPSLLSKTADLIASEKVSLNIKQYLANGITYAAARQSAIADVSKECAEILSLPNNILATEYISAMHKLGFNARFMPVKRIGAAHDSFNVTDDFTSASNLRKLIQSGEAFLNYVPENLHNLISENDFADISLLDSALLFKLRGLSINDFKNLPDISEGIENRIFEAIKTADSIEDLCNKIKTKRYTLSRIRRIVFSACFGIDSSFLKQKPPYIHVLGVNSRGKTLLSQISAKADIPIIVTGKDFLSLNGFAKKVFETEAVADDLYGLAFNTHKHAGSSYTLPLVKID